ncbi:MAG: FAD-dependent thymidylate synthase, partial [Pseudomonadota bacterium]
MAPNTPLRPDQQAEIDAQRAESAVTLRATAAGMEQHLYRAMPVLDHGFVRVIDYMGDDAAIVQAARVSYGRGTKAARDDRGLIRYLMRHWHSTPFEMCEVKLHVKLPIFVARQWIRHRTANVNEYSARYSILDREVYIPQPEQLAAQSQSNRQGRGDVLEGQEVEYPCRLFPFQHVAPPLPFSLSSPPRPWIELASPLPTI